MKAHNHSIRPISLCLCLTLVLGVLFSSGCAGVKSVGKITYQDFTEEDICYEDNTAYIDSELLITASGNYSYSDIKHIVGDHDGKIVGCIELTNDYQVEFQNKSYDELNAIADNLRTKIAGSDIRLHKVYSFDSQKASSKTDLSDGGNWWKEAINLDMLNGYNFKYKPVKVGIFDNAFDEESPDLSYAFKSGNTWQNEDINLRKKAHGTSVAGMISAKKDNDFGIDGIADNAELYGFAYLGSDDYDYCLSIMKYKYSIAKMLEKGTKIINFSNGYDEIMVAAQQGESDALEDLTSLSQPLSAFLKKYIDNGYEFLITKAAGNVNNTTWIECPESDDHPYGIKAYNEETDGKLSQYTELPKTTYTAEFDIFGAITDEEVANRIIMVGAVAPSKDQLSFSPADLSVRGDRIDIYAPGQDILCLIPKDENGNSSDISHGTSFSAPIVAGVAALVWGTDPELTTEEVRNTILNSSTKVEGENKEVIDAFLSVCYTQRISRYDKYEKNVRAALMGVVRDIDGERLPNVEITLKNDYGTETLTTDEDGFFDILLTGSTYDMTISVGDKYAPWEKQITVESGKVLYLDDIFLSEDRSYQHDSHLVEYGNYVYYADQSGVWSVNSDTNEIKQLASGNTINIASNGKVVYYTKFNKETSAYNSVQGNVSWYQYDLYSVNADGSDNKKIIPMNAGGQPLCVVDNTLYFTDYKDGFAGNSVGLAESLISYNPETKAKKLISDGANTTAVYDNKIYFSDLVATADLSRAQIHCYDIETGLLSDITSVGVLDFEIKDGILFYTTVLNTRDGADNVSSNRKWQVYMLDLNNPDAKDDLLFEKTSKSLNINYVDKDYVFYSEGVYYSDSRRYAYDNYRVDLNTSETQEIWADSHSSIDCNLDVFREESGITLWGISDNELYLYSMDNDDTYATQESTSVFPVITGDQEIIHKTGRTYYMAERENYFYTISKYTSSQ